MPLHVTDLADPEAAVIEFGDYLPVRFKLSPEPAFTTPYYWRCGDFDRSLLEIGLVSADVEHGLSKGSICSVVLTLFAEYTVAHNEDVDTGAKTVPGLPICDTGPWRIQTGNWRSDYFRDEHVSFSVVVDVDKVRVRIADTLPVEVWYAVGQAAFGVDTERSLCCLEFKAARGKDITSFKQLAGG